MIPVQQMVPSNQLIKLSIINIVPLHITHVFIIFQELQDYRYRLAELERALLLADERLHEHNIVDENLSAMLAQLKLNSDEQLRRYKHESECSYQSHVRSIIFLFV